MLAVVVVVVVVLEWWRLSEVEPVVAEQPADSEPADSGSGRQSEWCDSDCILFSADLTELVRPATGQLRSGQPHSNMEADWL